MAIRAPDGANKKGSNQKKGHRGDNSKSAPEYFQIFRGMEGH